MPLVVAYDNDVSQLDFQLLTRNGFKCLLYTIFIIFFYEINNDINIVVHNFNI